MKGEILFEKMTNISDEYVAEAAIGDVYGNPRLPRQESRFTRFVNSGWGVACLCAVVALAMVTAIIRFAPDMGLVEPGGVPTGQFSFSYEIKSQTAPTIAVNAGERFTVSTTVVNHGEAFTYWGSSSAYHPHAQFVLQGDADVILTGSIFETCDIATFRVEAGEAGEGTFDFHIPPSAVAGTYDLVLSYGGEEQVFDGVLTVKALDTSAVAATYVRLNDNGYDSFTITLYEEGIFTYYETLISSHIGSGSYTVNNGLVTLTDGNIPGVAGSLTHTYTFRYEGENLLYAAEASDGFTYIDLPDGALFQRVQKPEVSTEPIQDGDTISPPDLSGHVFYFGYQCAIPDDLHPGDSIEITAHVTNPGEAFTYVGDSFDFAPKAVLYHMDDPTYTVKGFPPPTGVEPVRCTVEEGAVGESIYTFRFPADAPMGEYGLILSYGESSQRYASVVTVVGRDGEN